MLSHDNVTWGAQVGLTHYQWHKEVFCSYLPFSHVAAHMIDVYYLLSCKGTLYFADKDALKGTLVYHMNLTIVLSLADCFRLKTLRIPDRPNSWQFHGSGRKWRIKWLKPNPRPVRSKNPSSVGLKGKRWNIIKSSWTAPFLTVRKTAVGATNWLTNSSWGILKSVFGERFYITRKTFSAKYTKLLDWTVHWRGLEVELPVLHPSTRPPETTSPPLDCSFRNCTAARRHLVL